jgi:hypothetical protein
MGKVQAVSSKQADIDSPGAAMDTTRYRKTREILSESYRSLPDKAVEQVVARQGLEAAAIEDFLDDVGNFVASALPAVGGAVGSIIAPGVGTAIGAGLGSAAGSALHAAIGPGQPPAPAPAAAPPLAAPAAVPAWPSPPSPSPLPGYSPMPGGYMPGMPAGYGGYPVPPVPAMPYPTAGPSSQQAVALLLQMMMQPQVLQALMQMLLGGAGSPTVPVGGTPVPVSAFTNMLSHLDEAAGAAYYGAGSHYGPRVDIASPEARASALVNMLHSSGDGGAGAAMRRRARRRRLAEVAEALRIVDANSAALVER